MGWEADCMAKWAVFSYYSGDRDWRKGELNSSGKHQLSLQRASVVTHLRWGIQPFEHGLLRSLKSPAT